MSLDTEVPEVLVNTGNMLHLWGSRLRIVVFLLVLAAYVYVLYSLKTAYMRSKRLDSIDNMVLKNEKLVNHIHTLDNKVMMRVNQLNDIFEDY